MFSNSAFTVCFVCKPYVRAWHAVLIGRAPAIPVPPAKQDKQTKVSPKALAARLREQAGKLVVKATAPENDDILVLSGDESDQDTPNEDAVLADASHSLVRTWQLAWQVKRQPKACVACVKCCLFTAPGRPFFALRSIPSQSHCTAVQYSGPLQQDTSSYSVVECNAEGAAWF